MLENQIYTILQKAKTVVITGHQNPDGDCLGSILGLGQSLEKAGKEVDFVLDDKIPDYLTYIPNVDKIKQVNTDKSYDLFIMVDIGDRERLGKAGQLMDKTSLSVCMDHHPTNEMICDYNLVKKDASSTCEVITDFLIRFDFPFSKNISTALFTGLITDTNRFLYQNARQAAMRIGADLLDRDADAELVYYNEYLKLDPDNYIFQAKMLESVEYLQEGKIVLLNLYQEKLSQYNKSLDDAEPIVALLKNIIGVEIACVIKEKADKEQKISLRSKLYYDVSSIAKEFGGGGHKQAAGCSLEMANGDAYNLIKERLEQVSWEDK